MQLLFDAGGNQTLIKTETGIWSAVYNAENRPVCFTNTESNTVVECAYDSMGRRAYKKVTVNGSVTLHQRYIYRGYLQIACSDLTRSHHPDLSYILWDPTQNVATRPLAIQINGTWYTYGWDLTKNICELYSTSGTISTSYTYSPFGRVTSTGNVEQPIRWSSEVWDAELGMVYYNWRYYNALVGRWNSKDLKFCYNLYAFCNNKSSNFDCLGLAYKNYFKIKTLEEIMSERGVAAYTGTTVSAWDLVVAGSKTAEEYTAYRRAERDNKQKIMRRIENKVIIRLIKAKLGLVELSDVTYMKGCGRAPKIDIITETLIPGNLRMTQKGAIMLFFHEYKRSKVYEYVYNYYIKKIEALRCPFSYSEANMKKFRIFYKETLNQAIVTAFKYAQSQLGDKRNSIGIDSENASIIFEDHNGNEAGWNDFSNTYSTKYNLIKEWTFHGFKNTYEVKQPREAVGETVNSYEFELPPCPSFD